MAAFRYNPSLLTFEDHGPQMEDKASNREKPLVGSHCKITIIVEMSRGQWGNRVIRSDYPSAFRQIIPPT